MAFNRSVINTDIKDQKQLVIANEKEMQYDQDRKVTMLAYSVEFDKDGNTTFSPAYKEFDNSVFFEQNFRKSASYRLETANGSIVLENFIDDMYFLEIGMAQNEKQKRAAKRLLENGINLVGKNGKKMMPANKGNVTHVSAFQSPGQGRNGNVFIYKGDVVALYNRMTDGGYDYIANSGLNAEKASKAAGRFSLLYSGYRFLTEIGNEDYHAILLGDTVNHLLNKGYSYAEANMSDGSEVTSAVLGAVDFNTTEEVAELITAQLRTLSCIIAKTCTNYMDHEAFKDYFVGLTDKLEFIAYDVFAGMVNAGDTDGLEGKFTVYGGKFSPMTFEDAKTNMDKIVTVYDQDAIKFINGDLLLAGAPIRRMVLNVANENDTAKTNVQVMNLPELFEDTKEFVEEKMITRTIENIEGEAVSDTSYDKTAELVNPVEAQGIQLYQRAKILNAEKVILKDITKLNANLSGCNNVIIPDHMHAAFGYPLLKIVDERTIQVFSADANRINAKAKAEGDKDNNIAWSVKYPCQELHAKQRVDLCGKNALLAAVPDYNQYFKNWDRTVNYKEFATKYLNSIDNGVALYPSLAILMDKQAGLDYDFDSITFIIEGEMVRAFDKHMRNISYKIVNR